MLDEIQDALGIPWAPASWRAYAVYPEAMALMWRHVAPVLRTGTFLKEALSITRFAYADVQTWFPAGVPLELSLSDQRMIRWEIDAFEFGNPQVLLQQLMLVEAFASELPAHAERPEFELPDAPFVSPSPYRLPEVQLVEEAAAPENVRRVYADIQATLGIALVNTDYQALAKWPDFLERAWAEVKPWVNAPTYGSLCLRVREQGQAAIGRLGGIEPGLRGDLERLLSEDEREHLFSMIAEFTELTPELIVVDALFRVQASRAAPVDESRAAPAESTSPIRVQ